MPFVDDNVGKRFGRLCILRPVTGQRRRLALCLCDCGKEFTADPRMLKRGDTASCGCLKADLLRNRTGSLVGRRFDKLEVVSEGVDIPYKGKGRNNRGWTCKCDCGLYVNISTNSLTSGNARSCGCLRSVAALMRNVPLYTTVIRNLKNRACIRGYVWEISDEQVENLITSNCSYCGKSPEKKSTASRLLRNGIDRVDNEIGYTNGNCVSCCKTCNQMKHSLGLSEFLNHIHAIARFTKVS